MFQNIRKNLFIYWAVLLAFSWNLFLLVGVVLNLDFAETRASGGQFNDFPVALRVVYLFQAVVVGYQVWIFKKIFHSESIKLKWLPKFFFIVGIIGIFLNAASRSSDERWNVIPALVITWAFWYFGVKRDK
jgi:hypothetical protein